MKHYKQQKGDPKADFFPFFLTQHHDCFDRKSSRHTCRWANWWFCWSTRYNRALIHQGGKKQHLSKHSCGGRLDILKCLILICNNPHIKTFFTTAFFKFFNCQREKEERERKSPSKSHSVCFMMFLHCTFTQCCWFIHPALLMSKLQSVFFFYRGGKWGEFFLQWDKLTSRLFESYQHFPPSKNMESLIQWMKGLVTFSTFSTTDCFV